jgi:glucokinase
LAPRLHELTAGDAGKITPASMLEAATLGDTEIEAAIERAARWLGIGIANAVTLTGVERVVITGGLSALGDRLTDPVRIEIRNRVRMFPPDDVQVDVSKIPDGFAGLLGAIAWAADSRRQHEKATWTTPTQT